MKYDTPDCSIYALDCDNAKDSSGQTIKCAWTGYRCVYME
jgi:hypothetical protein